MIAFTAAGQLQAANWFWNPDGTGGSEIWGTSPGEKNWNTVAGAPAGNIAWPNGIDDVAVFQDMIGGVVTVSEPLQTAGIIQNGADYTINAGVITLVPDSAAGMPFIEVQSGSLTIDSVLAGNNGLIKSGVGTLSLTGSNTYSGTTSIVSGTLINNGVMGDAFSVIDIAAGATLVAGGTQSYGMLTTTGTGPGNWLGNLANNTIVAPGGTGEAGILAVDGNFSQSPSGMLKLDLSATGNDLLSVTGSATFNGTLDLNQNGAAISPFVPVMVVSAASYAGNISSLSENLDGAVWFNPENGTITRIGLPSGGGGSFHGATRNQKSTWVSLYDDVIDPGVANITSSASGYDITSGIADTGNPDLLWALSASFTPEGLNAALLNRLSPEVYGSFSDYAMQATRSHQRSAFSAPALDPRDGSKSGIGNSAKSGAKDGMATAPSPLDWEFFAAMDYFSAGTDNSHNQADYDFDGAGILAGARTRLRNQTQLAVYLGTDSGTINGELIDADAFGWTFGVIGERLLDEKSRARLTAGISYGSYLFDGSRGSASATAAGWMPGKVDFNDADVDVFDLYVGIDGVAWKQDNLTLIPSVGLRYAMSKMDSFSESTGGASGSPIALDVNRDNHDVLLLELGLLSRVEVNPKLALWSEGGLNIGLLDGGRVIGASFTRGSRGMRAETEGLDDDSLYLGCGAIYEISENIHACIGYRADIRSGSEPQQELRLSSSWWF